MSNLRYRLNPYHDGGYKLQKRFLVFWFDVGYKTYGLLDGQSMIAFLQEGPVYK